MNAIRRRFVDGFAFAAVSLHASMAQSDPVRGDFDGDGYDDLAIAARYDNVGDVEAAGAVNVIYGSAQGLAVSRRAQRWHQDSPGVAGTAEPFEGIWALAYGDFNGDGFADLAFGVPDDRVNGVLAGAVNVLYGSNDGLTSYGNQRWHQNSANVLGVAEDEDNFGEELAGGDFNGDGFADLAIGVSTETVDGIATAGAVNVLYGSASGLTAADNQLWHKNTPGVLGVAADDAFGHELATGDFNQDGFQDIAIGAQGETVGGVDLAGGVHILFGSSDGLTALHDQVWHQASAGIAGAPAFGDRFGERLRAGDFNGDGVDDLAIGVRENESLVVDGVHVIYGFQGTGLASPGNHSYLYASDLFVGTGLAVGDFDGDDFDDLAIGIPGDDTVFSEGGAVRILFGTAGGVTSVGTQFWTQDSPGILDEVEDFDYFGFSLAAADFDGDGNDDLAVGVTRESLPDGPDVAGAVNVLYGTFDGLGSEGNQFWHQDSPGVPGVAEHLDRFGYLDDAG
jgi:hypothetical protein